MMRFKGPRALRVEWPEAESIVQVRVITERGSTIDIEGPVTSAAATVIARLAMGQVDDAVAVGWRTQSDPEEAS